MQNLVLKNLELVHFKNHKSAHWDFNSKVNIITGSNGNGKTNVLDAIHYLSFTKSYLNSVDSQNITHGEQMSLIKGVFDRFDAETVVDLGLKKGQKKVVRVAGKEVEKLANHIGYIPVVMITPSDRDLIMDAAEIRRRFINSTVSQNNAQYLHALMGYQRALQQRNTLLKYFASNRTFDPEMLAVYNDQLVEHADTVYQGRKGFIEALEPELQRFYEALSGGKEKVQLRYKSALNDNSMEEILEENLDKDRVMQYTTSGLHRDDAVFQLEGHSIKKLGSQGQQKSFLIALKLAQFELTRDALGIRPLLLLDDIFDKLDEGRVSNLLGLVHSDDFGQIFITDTHTERMTELSKNLRLNHNTFEICDNGQVQAI